MRRLATLILISISRATSFRRRRMWSDPPLTPASGHRRRNVTSVDSSAGFEDVCLECLKVPVNWPQVQERDLHRNGCVPADQLRHLDQSGLVEVLTKLGEQHAIDGESTHQRIGKFHRSQLGRCPQLRTLRESAARLLPTISALGGSSNTPKSAALTRSSPVPCATQTNPDFKPATHRCHGSPRAR